MNHLGKGNVLIAIAILAAFVGGIILASLVEDECCLICDSIPYHAPCIIDLHTGAITEMRIYETHPVKAAELATDQSGGYFAISSETGIIVTRWPDEQIAYANIPLREKSPNAAGYCENCLESLNKIKGRYAILDMYVPEETEIYEISEGSICEMRCYTVKCVLDNNEDQYKITVYGCLFGENQYSNRRRENSSIHAG